MADQSALLEFFSEHTRGTLATIKRNGVPELSTVAYAFDPRSRVIRISVTDDRAKVVNLRRIRGQVFTSSARTAGPTRSGRGAWN